MKIPKPIASSFARPQRPGSSAQTSRTRSFEGPSSVTRVSRKRGGPLFVQEVRHASTTTAALFLSADSLSPRRVWVGDHHGRGSLGVASADGDAADRHAADGHAAATPAASFPPLLKRSSIVILEYYRLVRSSCMYERCRAPTFRMCPIPGLFPSTRSRRAFNHGTHAT